MNHRHEPLVGLDGLIRCKGCGEILEYAEKELAKVSSARMATKVLTKIAYEGGFKMDSIEGEFIVYSKDKNGIREEVSARKKTDRVYVIVQKFISKGGDMT